MRIEVGQAALDEAPASDRPFEMWQVQGFYSLAAAGRRHFAVSLVRQAVPMPRGKPRSGFALLLSVLDPATGRRETLSQLDAASVAGLPRLVRAALGRGLQRHVLEAFASEIERYGLPRPHRCVRAAVRLRARPFRATWKGFRLARSRGGFELSFAEPGSGRRCRFRLRPAHPPLGLRDVCLFAEKSVECAALPRLALAGEVAGEAATGEAWLEHHWGDLGWFVSLAENRVLGWDRLAVNLDDGSDLVLAVHRDADDGSIVHRYAAGLVGGQEAALSHDMVLAPLRHWESARNGVRYPVALKARVPELGLELEFEPLADDQEVPVPGPLRAIWQGAGMVRGRLRGRRVAGHARLELHGYGYVLDGRQYLDQWADRLDAHLADFLPEVLDASHLERYAGPARWRRDPAAHTAMLSQPLWDLVRRRGKHWRPMFGMLLLDALGTPSKPYEALAAITAEMAHTGSLIVDDIQDGSPTRRGAESIHLRYGTDVAINAANTAYFLAYAALRDYPHLTDAQRLELYRIASRHSVRAHLGQGQDIYWSRHLNPETLDRWLADSLAPQILQAYADKTATPVEGMAETACVLADADAATRDACVAFARAFGVAFQIVDDVLDFSDARHRAGTGGKDLAEGKLTYVLFRALEALRGRRRARLRDILCERSRDRRAEALHEAAQLVRQSGALEACRQEAIGIMEDGWQRLSVAIPPSEPKSLLRALCLALLQADGTEAEHSFGH